MAPRITALVEDVRMGATAAPAAVEIDELIPIYLNGAMLYYRRISVEPLEPEWEIEMAQ